jgi:hypothetical protein
MTPRRPIVSMYEYFFLGNCFSWKNFGHKEIDYREYPRNDHRRNGGMYNSPGNNCIKKKFKNIVENININPIYPVLNYYLECHKCNNFGRKDRDCKSWI